MKVPVKWIMIPGLAVIILLAIDVVVLSVKNRDLKDQIREITGFEMTEPLESGTLAESISVKFLAGRTDFISYDNPDANYLLLVFSTTCPHCEANITTWTSLNDTLNGRCYVIALSVDDVDRTIDYVAKKDFPFYTVILNDSTYYRRYKISGVPVTMLIAGDARVKEVWKGELNDEQVVDIISHATVNAAASLVHE